MHGLFDDHELPPEIRDRARSELRSGERMLWVGQPRPNRFARQSIPVVLFGIPWTAFSIFWVAAASGILFGGFGQNNGEANGFGAFAVCFPLFGLPFVLIGLAMLSSPYWLWRQAKRTIYAVTDQRAILWNPSTFGGVEVRSYGPEWLGKIIRNDYSDGSGDLIFEEVTTIGRDSDGHRTTHIKKLGFMGIKDVRKIEELLRKGMRTNIEVERDF
jgi:hypothetical protein